MFNSLPIRIYIAEMREEGKSVQVDVWYYMGSGNGPWTTGASVWDCCYCDGYTLKECWNSGFGCKEVFEKKYPDRYVNKKQVNKLIKENER